MAKIQSQAGNSLADVYDVEGSIAGIDNLATRELPIVHEMGATIWSERFSTAIRRETPGAISQSSSFNLVISDLPANVFRIFAISVFSGTAGRIQFASVATRDPVNGREIPIWAWQSANDVEMAVRFSDDGGAVATQRFLIPAPGAVTLPHMMAGVGQPQNVRDLAFRGFTEAFGAGDITPVILVHVGFVQVLGLGLSSRGLPVPSW